MKSMTQPLSRSRITLGRMRGVTLIELMIVVVILSIIAAIAYPNFSRQARKAGRADATSSLLAIAAAQEKEYLKNNAYTNNMTLLGGTSSEANKYTLSVALTDGGGYLAKAEPAEGSSQEGDKKCIELTIDHLGAKRSRSVSGENDEETVDSTGCW